MDESKLNDNWEEDAANNVLEAIDNQDWETCRATLTDMEGYGFNTWELRRRMNAAMNEEKSEYTSYTPMDSVTVDQHITNSSESYGNTN